ncbi:MAG: DUF421 domain-containing protein [Firmicutes bacterium]|nr:DUF421 domain-containing protein [Bacillota bacterium]
MLNLFARTAVLYLVAVVVIRIMGKRQIGQLQPFELVITIIIAELVVIPMQDKDVPLIEGLVPVFALLVLQYGVSLLLMKSEGIRAVVCGVPSVLVHNGQIVEQELHRLRYTLSDLLEQLRVKGFANLSDVEFAILETNGELSVIPKSQKRPVQPEDLQIDTEYEGLPLPLILDGKVKKEALQKAELDYSWLQDELVKRGVGQPQDVLYASLGTDGTLYVQPREMQLGWQESGVS